MQRPQFITYMAVLAAIGGVLGIFGAFALFGLGALSGAVLSAVGETTHGFLYGGFAIFWALVVLVQSAAELLFAYGAWFLKPWAWKLGIGIEGASVLIAFINWIGGSSDFFGFLFSAIIAGAIIYFLMRPDIKKAFGQA
jgi:hypothetical protein